MLNFAEQTGSGAVIVVWSFLLEEQIHCIITNQKGSCEINRRHSWCKFQAPAGGFPGLLVKPILSLPKHTARLPTVASY